MEILKYKIKFMKKIKHENLMRYGNTFYKSYYINNAEFMVGDVEVAFDELINKRNIIPTAIIVDPPRKGLDEKTIQNILKIKPEKLVYISCNPATMVRDLAKMEEVYNIKKVQPVDMFPFTKHVECVAVIELW